ncbi:MAG: ribonuclease Z, partial [Deferribacteraceae bacterium]|nr:ribonuclease Z [Deferribacteraceae bacterium]
RNVWGKFAGYTWNLTENYGFTVSVYELDKSGRISCGVFKASNAFEPELSEKEKVDIGEGFTLTYEFFDHRTPSLGYRIIEPLRLSVDTDKLALRGYKTGPWIKKLKNAVLQGCGDLLITSPCEGGEVTKKAAEFSEEFLIPQKPSSITYITDCAPTDENMEKAVNFARGTDLLIVEAMFTAADAVHAAQKNHLTIDRAKKIFWDSNARSVRFTHFSSRYEQNKKSFFKELTAGLENRIYSTE